MVATVRDTTTMFVDTLRNVERLSGVMDPSRVPLKITCVIVVTPLLSVSDVKLRYLIALNKVPPEAAPI